jgi:ABC-2 type transport system permease protein
MKLFWFETYKTFSRWRTYIGFIAIGVVVVVSVVVMKLSATEISSRMMKIFQKDFLISGNVLNGWFVTAFIMNTLHIHIPFLIALVAGDMVSGEATTGTVRFLLIRPPSRTRILIAKYLTALFYTAGVVLFFAGVCIVLGLILFGQGDLVVHHYGKFGIVLIPEAEIPVRMFLAFCAAFWSMTVVASLAFLFSTLAENSIGPIIGTMAVVIIFLVFSNLPLDFFRNLSPYLFTHYMGLWQRFFDQPIPWKEIVRSILLLGIHHIFLFSMALIIYRRKDIKS